MEESDIEQASSHQTSLTWQCWMVNRRTGAKKLIVYGYSSQEECRREAVNIFTTTPGNIDSYPSKAGWELIYRQDSPLKIAEYWRDYYQEQAKLWSQRYEEVWHLHNPSFQPLPSVERPQKQASTVGQKLSRRRLIKKRTVNALEVRYKRVLKRVVWSGRLLVGTLFCAIALELVTLLKNSSNNPLYLAQRTTDIPLSIRELFTNKKAPGSIAIGVAEGNLTPTGKPTSIYLGHTDPGNFATNKGFCSWNKAQGLSVAEADQRCLEALQWQSVATENQLIDLGLSPESHKVAIIMGTDLWNQSNSAGPMFPFTYKAAKNKGFKGRRAYIWARVEAFRNKQQELDASGLFGICRREPYYQKQLIGLKVDSEAWRWNCIKLDQMRRILEIEKVLKSGSFCVR